MRGQPDFEDSIPGAYSWRKTKNVNLNLLQIKYISRFPDQFINKIKKLQWNLVYYTIIYQVKKKYNNLSIG